MQKSERVFQVEGKETAKQSILEASFAQASRLSSQLSSLLICRTVFPLLALRKSEAWIQKVILPTSITKKAKEVTLVVLTYMSFLIPVWL
jgi:hypothetical protein